METHSAGYRADPHPCRLLAGWPEQEVPTYECESCGQRMHGHPAMIEHRHLSVIRQQEAEIERLRDALHEIVYGEGDMNPVGLIAVAKAALRNDSQASQ